MDGRTAAVYSMHYCHWAVSSRPHLNIWRVSRGLTPRDSGQLAMMLVVVAGQ